MTPGHALDAARTQVAGEPGFRTRPMVASAARVAVEAARAAAATAPAGQADAARRRAQLSTFLDLSAQIFCITDFTGALVWWNAASSGRSATAPRSCGAYGSTTWSIPTTGRCAGRPRRCWPRTVRSGLDPDPVLHPARRVALARVDHPRRLRAGSGSTERPGTSPRRRRDEIALSESEARLRAIMKYSPSVIFVKDLEGRYLLVNDEFSTRVGHSRGRRRWA